MQPDSGRAGALPSRSRVRDMLRIRRRRVLSVVGQLNAMAALALLLAAASARLAVATFPVP